MLPGFKTRWCVDLFNLFVFKEEDKTIADWLIEEQDASGIRLNIDAAWGIIE